MSGGNANSSDWALENGHKSSPRVHHWEWLDRDCAEDLFLREGHGEGDVSARHCNRYSGE